LLVRGGKRFILDTTLSPLLVCMKAFEVRGQYKISLRRWQPFAIEVVSSDEKGAVERSYALIGSRHKVKRKFVKIEGVKTLGPEEVTDHAVKYKLEVAK